MRNDNEERSRAIVQVISDRQCTSEAAGQFQFRGPAQVRLGLSRKVHAVQVRIPIRSQIGPADFGGFCNF